MKKLPRGLRFDKKRGQYQIRFKSRSLGKVYSEFLPKGTSKKKALEYFYHLKEKDRLGELKSRRERERGYKFGEFVQEYYLPYSKSHNKESTVEWKKRKIEELSPWFWKLYLEEIGQSEINKYVRERKQDGVRNRTINMGIGIVQHVLNVAHEEKILKTPPPRFRKLPEKDKRPSRYLTVEEAERVIETATERGEPWKAVVLFLLHTGARWGETRGLKWEDIDLDEGFVIFKKTKGGRSRTVPLLPEVVEELKKLERRGEFVFMVKKRGGDYGQLPKFQGGPRRYPWDPPGMKVSPHVFRHTFAAWRLRAGVGLEKVQKWLGHSSISMTVDIYGHILPEEHREEIGKYPKRSKGKKVGV